VQFSVCYVPPLLANQSGVSGVRLGKSVANQGSVNQIFAVPYLYLLPLCSFLQCDANVRKIRRGLNFNRSLNTGGMENLLFSMQEMKNDIVQIWKPFKTEDEWKVIVLVCRFQCTVFYCGIRTEKKPYL